MTVETVGYYKYAHFVAEDQGNAPYVAVIIPDKSNYFEGEHYDDIYVATEADFGWRTLRCVGRTESGSLRFVDPHEADWRHGHIDMSNDCFDMHVRVDGVIGRAPYRRLVPQFYGIKPYSRRTTIETRPLPQAARTVEFHGVSKDGRQRLVVMRPTFYRCNYALFRAYIGNSQSATLSLVEFRQPVQGFYNEENNTLVFGTASGHRLILWQLNEGTHDAMLHWESFEIAPLQEWSFEEEGHMLRVSCP